MMRKRLSDLKSLRSVWNENDVTPTLEILQRLHYPALTVDMLNLINLKPRMVTLDASVLVLPLLVDVLQSKFESYVYYYFLILQNRHLVPALTMLNQITKQYGGLIADTLAYGGSTGVDLTREARYVWDVVWLW